MPVFELVLKEDFSRDDPGKITGDPNCTFGGWRSDNRGPVLRVIYHFGENTVPNFSKYGFIERVEEGRL